MQPLLLLPLILALAPASATVHVDVFPCLDSDAWSEEHVQALRTFLEWCADHGVKVAVFHYNTCEEAAPGITQVIREFAGQGVITLVGLHSTSHSMGDLPVSVQYLELKYNAEFLRESVGINVNDRVLSVPYWVFSPRTLEACALFGVRVIVSGNGPNTLSPEHDRVWDKVSFPGQLMIPGKFTVGGEVIYHLPVVSYPSLAAQSAALGTTVGEVLRRAVESLIENGLVPTDRDVRLTLAVLVHPWELADSGTLEGIEGLLEQVSSGALDFACNGVPVVFRLADPAKVVEDLEEGRFEGPVVSLPSPDYRYVLLSKGYKPWWELLRQCSSDENVIHVIRTWREAVQTLECVDAELLTLLRAGRTEGLDTLLREVAETAADEAELYNMVKNWDPAGAKRAVERFREVADRLYSAVVRTFADFLLGLSRELEGVRELRGLVSDVAGSVEELRARAEAVEAEVTDLRREVDSLRGELEERTSRLEGRVKDVEERLSELENEIRGSEQGRESPGERGGRAPVVAPFVPPVPRGRGAWKRGTS